MADIAIFRINYKSDFILTLQSDAGWATPFCIKFWTGAPSQAYFVGYDGDTYTHCAPVVGDPTKLAVQFDDHGLPIGNLKFQIGYHFTVADFPTTVEDEVINQAAVIIDQDGTPMKVMLDFQGETAPEIQFSLPAYANEAQRIANEQQRIADEQERIENEQQRIADEETRQAQEAQRIAQDTARVNEFATLKLQSQAATSAANTAAALANEKAQLAADKAALAQQKADYAQTQGDYAKEQGDTALADHERAEADHAAAAADHTTAQADHAQAATDHTTAAADHTTAQADHAQAVSDHAAVEPFANSLGAYDISSAHASGGVMATYADLTDALGTNGANIPEGIRKGGMSVKFVQSSDSKYVSYRLMSQTFSTTVTDWQGVDDVPTAGSDNLVKSGGVDKYTNEIPKSEYLEKHDISTYVNLLDCQNIVAGKTYVISYSNKYNSVVSLGTALSGTFVQAVKSGIQYNDNGKVEFTANGNANQIRLYADTRFQDGYFECYLKEKDDTIVLYKEFSNTDLQLNHFQSGMELFFQVIEQGSEVDGYYANSLVDNNGKRRLPIDLNGLIGKSITIALDSVDSGSSRRIGFTNDISDLSAISWTSYVTEKNFESGVGKTLVITGRYLLISYHYSTSITGNILKEPLVGGSLVPLVQDISKLQDVTYYHYPCNTVSFEEITSSITYKDYNFIANNRYIIHYKNLTDRDIVFGTGNGGEPVQSSVVVLGNGTSSSFEFTPILSATQIRLYASSVPSSGNLLFYIENVAAKRPLDAVNEAPTFITCFKKITCVGDSLTEGGFNTTEPSDSGANLPDYSYPSFMQKHTGVTTINLGYGGRCASREDSTRSWYDRAITEGSLIESNIGNITIIALGSNDIHHYDSFTGNVQTDIDITNRNNNALTSVGGYANIIQAIREICPQTTIFCVTISNTRNTDETRTDANDKIKAIAALFDNCFVIDMQNYAETTNYELQYFVNHYKNGSHNNALGYELRSRQLISYIDWIIENNPDDFCNLQFFGTNNKYVK